MKGSTMYYIFILIYIFGAISWIGIMMKTIDSSWISHIEVFIESLIVVFLFYNIVLMEDVIRRGW